MHHTIVRLLVTGAVFLVLGSCGGDAEESTNEPTTGSTSTVAPSDVEPEPATTTTTNEPPSVGTVTLADGTVYEFDMFMCETDALEDEPYYVLKGFTDGGMVGDREATRIDMIFQRTNASGNAFISARLYGEFDDGSRFAYSSKGELTPSGEQVTGTVTLDQAGGAPLGPSIDVTVDVTCGALAEPPPFGT
ncbi:hypothetical protein BH20CHL6_BH20CHL6_07410 [soil metagenome]